MQTMQIIAGHRPVGPCRPDGSYRWATRYHEDGRYTFTTYNGWLIASETTTDDRALAEYITKALQMEMGP